MRKLHCWVLCFSKEKHHLRYQNACRFLAARLMMLTQTRSDTELHIAVMLVANVSEMVLITAYNTNYVKINLNRSVYTF